MTYEILIGSLALIGMLAGVISPIIKLNNNITELRASVDSLRDIILELKSRITSHGKEIDDIKVELADHEARIRQLEKD
jgi:uncharacterized coiled-coil DUF342 family protein